ncbi:MAG TPA: class I SAM-dependent methyltransferase [Solirubrobacteraceae bacterium]|nr:class I SAM-dependent methyltransferase [Solirubrobacteraceae bacterium]
MSTSTDWVAWHRDYQDPASALSRRLRVVQDQLRIALPIRPREPVQVISLCAGRGDDLIEVLRDYPYAGLVRARLVELDPQNVDAMRAAATEAGLELDIVQGDAAEPTLYQGAVPADVVLLCGVLGNVSEPDARFTISSLSQVCRTGGTVIWTRSRRAPDLTPRVRGWFAASGFSELAFVAPGDALWSVGAARFDGKRQPLGSRRFFTFHC